MPKELSSAGWVRLGEGNRVEEERSTSTLSSYFEAPGGVLWKLGLEFFERCHIAYSGAQYKKGHSFQIPALESQLGIYSMCDFGQVT